MNVECVICLESLQPAEAISNTPCGHVFHHPCVSKWFQRSSTCPECRKKVHGKKLHKIYFNFVDEDTVMGELTSMLETEIETLKHQLTVKEEKIARGIETENILLEKNKVLQSHINDLTTEMRDDVAKLEKIKTNVQSAGNEIDEIIEKLRITIEGCISEKTADAPNSTDLIIFNSAE